MKPVAVGRFHARGHQIHIVATADVSRESPKKAYQRALADIAAIEKKLSRGLKPAQWRMISENQKLVKR